ncbi:MAG: tetrahydromethanopterin S-methyltransferase subunit A [candidate division KSB1 bacterium]|nr:tetrahydromethanopterin S-methyltransferase subunit A [candidate division KSB1 bacterium]MDZ7302189.1 tetrahydromethanopterin S-methyltransferase subunit A [candidate division KSB1 bacterium]MDZ7311298.1 tetrahydromethanopterin S-methyltransferase subunit A [candidate division KSB1 bacterium]
MEQKNNELLSTLAEELQRIHSIPKCAGCKCFADTVQEFRAVAEKQNANGLIERINALAAKISVTHDCIGCNPCYPVEVSNALNEMEEAEGRASFPLKAGACSENTCGCTSSPRQQKREAAKSKWPPEAGDYLVGNPEAPVAITTLASEELPRQFKRAIGLKNVAIIGRTCTENIGIEKVVKNIIANPAIRFLIVCGQESGASTLNGHLAGQTFLALKKNGINTQQRIIGSPGKRPVLKNTGFAEVERFQRQIELIDLIGCEDVSRIAEETEKCAARHLPAFFPLALVEPEVEIIHAEPMPKLQLDKNGYFIILPRREHGEILIEHYRNDGMLQHRLVGNNAADLCNTIIHRELVTQLDHAAYLGRELARAEFSLWHDAYEYAQDKA